MLRKIYMIYRGLNIEDFDYSNVCFDLIWILGGLSNTQTLGVSYTARSSRCYSVISSAPLGHIPCEAIARTQR